MAHNIRTIFLIPGFKQKATDRNFAWLIKFLKVKGFRVMGVPIKWDYRTMSDYVNDFKKFYCKHKTNENRVLGFSYGAVVAFMTASELKPKKIYLCSLSPDFKEDAAKMKPHVVKLIGKNRFADVKTRSAKKIAKELKIPTVIFYGEAESKKYPQLKVRGEETARFAKRSKLVIVKQAPHKIDYLEYIKAIKGEFE